MKRARENGERTSRITTSSPNAERGRERRLRREVCLRRQTRAETRAEKQAEENERCLQDRQKRGRGRQRQGRDMLVTRVTKKRNTRDITDIQEIDV